MGCKFSFKRVFLVASLCLAGLFGVSSVVVNEQVKETPAVEKAEAVIPSYIYYTITSDCWGGFSDIENDSVYFDSGSTKTYRISDNIDGAGKNIMSRVAAKDSYPGFIRIDTSYNSSATKIKFHNGTTSVTKYYTQTPNMTIPTDGRNLFVLDSSRAGIANQHGFWTYYEYPEPSYEKADTLYFVPNDQWANNYDASQLGYRHLWPQLTFTYSGGTITKYADGVTNPSPSWATKTRWYVFYFRNIPIVKPSLMKIIAGINEQSDGSEQYISFGNDTREAWCSSTTGAHTANVFGIDKSGWIGSYSSNGHLGGYYSENQMAKAFLLGSFVMHGNIASDDNWPHEFNSFTTETSGVYSTTLYVTAGDTFKYKTYSYFDKESNGDGKSHWYLNGLISTPYNSDNMSSITVYENGALQTKTDYIEAGDNKFIRFKKPGTVKFRRTTNAVGSASLELHYLSDTQSDYYIIGSGSFNDGKSSWETSSGIRLVTDKDNKGLVANQYLEAGDVFKISNGTDYYGFDKLVGKDITYTDYFHQAKFNLVTITGYTGSDGWETWNYTLENYSGVNGGSGETNATGGTYTLYWKTTSDWDNSKSGGHGVRAYYGEGDGQWTGATLVDEEERIYTNSDIIFDLETLSGLNIYKNNGSGNQGTSWISRSNFYNGNIVVKKTGYYNIFLDNSNNINVSLVSTVSEFQYKDALYLDLNGQDWQAGNAHIAARFWNGRGSLNVEMTLMYNHGSSHVIYEVMIPEIDSKNPTGMCFYRCEAFDPSEMGEWNKTGDLSYTNGANVYQLSAYTTGSWNRNISNIQRAEFFGSYFNSMTDGANGGVCSSTGGTDIDQLKSKWLLAKNEYDSMCLNAQGKVWKASPDEEGTSLEQAMARYDYVVFTKHYTNLIVVSSEDKTDFIGRGNEDSGRIVSAIQVHNHLEFPFDGEESSFSNIVIVIASSVSLLSITALSILLVKKRKSKEQ